MRFHLLNPSIDFPTKADRRFRFLLACRPTGAVFTAISVGQMVLWALKKKGAYKKEFGSAKTFPKGRKAIFPGLI